jgi:hypothetical protein
LSFISSQEVAGRPYSEAYFDFGLDYERVNPITRKQGYETYINRLYEKKYISEEEYNELLVDLRSRNAVNIMEVYHNARGNNKLPYFNSLFLGEKGKWMV